MSKIKAAYDLACSSDSKIRNLGKWMKSAIKEGWDKDTAPGNRQHRPKYQPKTNPFNDFEQNSYDFETLEKEVVLNAVVKTGETDENDLNQF